MNDVDVTLVEDMDDDMGTVDVTVLPLLREEDEETGLPDDDVVLLVEGVDEDPIVVCADCETHFYDGISVSLFQGCDKFRINLPDKFRTSSQRWVCS